MTLRLGRSKRAELRRLYLIERRKGTRARYAIRNARVRMDWRRAEVGEHDAATFRAVRLRVVADECCDLDNLFGDTFNPEVNDDIPRARLERERKAEVDRVNRDGVWGVVGEYYDGETWVHADSCFGFIGDDWKDSGYDVDIMRATLDAAKSARKCKACGRPRGRVAA